MSRKFSVDYDTYKLLLQAINQLSLKDDLVASEVELSFIKEEAWLPDSVVIERVVKRKGTYYIDLLFAHHKQPFRFIIRNITHHSDLKKAGIMSQIFRRQAAKDQRGTLQITEESLNLAYN